MENTSTGAQAATENTAQAVNTQTKMADSPAEGSQNPATEDLATVKAKYEKSVQAEKNLRARLKEAEAAETKLKEIEQASMTEAEKLKAQLAELQQFNAKATAEANRARAQVVAQQNGFLPDAAALWLESQNQTDWTPEGIAKMLTGAPAWVKAPEQAGVTTAAGNPARQGASLTREIIEKMSEAEINARWPEVQAVLSKG